MEIHMEKFLIPHCRLVHYKTHVINAREGVRKDSVVEKCKTLYQRITADEYWNHYNHLPLKKNKYYDRLLNLTFFVIFVFAIFVFVILKCEAFQRNCNDFNLISILNQISSFLFLMCNIIFYASWWIQTSTISIPWWRPI